MKKISFLLALIFAWLPNLLVTKNASAQDKTLYFMGIQPQGNLLNPAFQSDYSYFTFAPSVHSFFNNSSLTVNSLLTKKTVNSKSELYWDFETIDKKLKNNNYLDAGVKFTPFFVGLKLKKQWYLNFSTSIIGISYFSYPGSISLIRFGNADLENNKPRTIDLNNYNYNELSYVEHSFGVSKKINSKLNVGMHFKTLMGLSAIKTNHFLASVETRDDFSESLLSTDISINVSGALFDADKVNNVFGMKKNFGSFLFGEESVSIKNMGFAFDLGFGYQLNEKLSFYGSVLDIGLIHWGLEPQKLVSDDNYLFNGIYFSPYVITEEEFDFNDYLKQYLDTITATIIPEVQNEQFNTWLFPKTYLGVTYQLSSKILINGLLNTIAYNDAFLVKSTIGTTWLASERLKLTGTFSYNNYSFYNFGFGVSYSCDFLHLYAATDNINSIDIRNSKGLNFALGINIPIWKDYWHKNESEENQE